MKLFAKYNRISLLATVFIFLLAAVAFYFSLRYVLIRQLDESLEAEQHEIEIYAGKYGQLPEAISVEDQQVVYEETSSMMQRHRIQNLSLYDSIEKDQGAFRQLVFTIAAAQKIYKIKVSKSLESTQGITRSVVSITTITILLILLAAWTINRLVLKKLWQPFYATVNAMQHYKLGQQMVSLPQTAIEEFDLLNNTLQKTITKADTDYLMLKEFTENAAHELQTPLAIIRSKLELLVQDENLSLQQSEAMQAANDALQKMAGLNRSLLLLAKIENHQFAETNAIHLKEKIENKLMQFSELVQSLSVAAILDDIIINMNSELADIMLNNLLSNAIRHNRENGEIKLQLTAQSFTISNSATHGPLDMGKLFTRFYKAEQTVGSHGLGLSIVKQICDVSGYVISYSFADERHHFSIKF